jgi:DNA-binding response OmpR family regulator
MKLLLVASGDRYLNVLGFHLRPLGFAIEHLADPVQAVARLDEIEPEAVLFHAGDFPRHWKPALKMAREHHTREELIFVLITPADFEVEEAAKAAHLGANGIVGSDLTDKKELYRLEELFRRYRPMDDKRTVTRVVPGEEEALVFAFTHPVRRSLVAGKIREISIQGASFKPAPGSVVSDLEAGCRVPVCSLKLAEKSIVDLSARVTRNRSEMGFQFLDFETNGRSRLLAWIEARSERALKNAAAVLPAAQPS